jgi:hypothetical protein
MAEALSWLAFLIQLLPPILKAGRRAVWKSGARVSPVQIKRKTQDSRATRASSGQPVNTSAPLASHSSL